MRLGSASSMGRASPLSAISSLDGDTVLSTYETSPANAHFWELVSDSMLFKVCHLYGILAMSDQ